MIFIANFQAGAVGHVHGPNPGRKLIKHLENFNIHLLVSCSESKSENRIRPRWEIAGYDIVWFLCLLLWFVSGPVGVPAASGLGDPRGTSGAPGARAKAPETENVDLLHGPLDVAELCKVFLIEK